MFGRIISRVDQTAPGLWSITLRAPQLAVVIACVPPQAPVVALLDRRPDGEHRTADAQVRLVRERTEGGRVIALAAGRDIVELSVQVGEFTRVIRFDRDGLRVLDADPDLSLAEVAIPEHDVAAEPEPLILALHRAMLTEAERGAAQRLLKTALRKLGRRLQSIRDDELRAQRYEQDTLRARALVAIAARAPRGTTLLEGIDYSSGCAEPVRLEMDPARTPREQIEEVFARARRMKRGELVRNRRAAEAEQASNRVEQALAGVARAVDPRSVREAYQSAADSLPAGIRPRANSQQGGAHQRATTGRRSAVVADASTQTSKCAREYRALDGSRVLVGRDARGNDVLTTRVARPHDIWMHARDCTGSHVVISAERGKAPSPEALVDAATLAAHFSEARGSDFVEVAWCERRFVRKPKGAPAGLVTLAREKILGLRFETARLERLLATVR